MKIEMLFFLLILCIKMFYYTPLFSQITVTPISDGNHDAVLPANFRVPKDSAAILKDFADLDEGFYDIPASGSGQFSELSFKGLVSALSQSLMIVVDLRQESHGLINGKAVSWTDGRYNWANAQCTSEEIERDERKHLQQAVENGQLLLNAHTIPQEWIVERVQTEKEFICSLGFPYVRIPVQDHCRPTDQVVDQFVQLIVSLPPETWIHFHCRAGKGRTTTFLTMYDMMLNASHVSLESILTRHKLIGGTDLFKIHEPTHYKHELAITRLEFVKKFYLYCQQVPDFTLSWSEWLERQAILTGE